MPIHVVNAAPSGQGQAQGCLGLWAGHKGQILLYQHDEAKTVAYSFWLSNSDMTKAPPLSGTGLSLDRHVVCACVPNRTSANGCMTCSTSSIGDPAQTFSDSSETRADLHV